MKVSEHDSTIEKRILTGMIVDTVVLGHISEKWNKEEGLFRVRWANTVGGWAVRYHRKYNKAPAADIRGLFEAWAAQHKDADTVALVDRFLVGLSDEFENSKGLNSAYLIDTAGQHFNAVALERMAEAVKGHVDGGDVAKALDAVAKWNKVEMGVGAGVDIFTDEAAVRNAFETKTEPLITYPGALGDFFGDQLGRDEFVAITGATGRGKTWWLMDIAWMAVRAMRKVAFFGLGDMSQDQMIRRFMCRATGHPLQPHRKTGWVFEIPVAITREDGESMATVETEPKDFKGPLQWQNAWKVLQEKSRRHSEPLLRLSTHPNSSINVDGVIGVLNVWERSGWVPDVIVLDYADILAAPAGYTPGDREAINATWKQLRGLSQRKHNLVVTATQADAASYTAQTISRSNFSDDRRKNDHVTGMLGINATEDEKEKGIFRLNWTKRREAEFAESRCVHVVGNLGLGRPHCRSTF